MYWAYWYFNVPLVTMLSQGMTCIELERCGPTVLTDVVLEISQSGTQPGAAGPTRR